MNEIVGKLKRVIAVSLVFLIVVAQIEPIQAKANHGTQSFVIQYITDHNVIAGYGEKLRVDQPIDIVFTKIPGAANYSVSITIIQQSGESLYYIHKVDNNDCQTFTIPPYSLKYGQKYTVMINANWKNMSETVFSTFETMDSPKLSYDGFGFTNESYRIGEKMSFTGKIEGNGGTIDKVEITYKNATESNDYGIIYSSDSKQSFYYLSSIQGKTVGTDLPMKPGFYWITLQARIAGGLMETLDSKPVQILPASEPQSSDIIPSRIGNELNNFYRMGDRFEIPGYVDGNGEYLDHVSVYYRLANSNDNLILLNSVKLQKNVRTYQLSALGTYTVGYNIFKQSGEYTVYIYAQNKGKENNLVFSQNVTIYGEIPTSTVQNNSISDIDRNLQLIKQDYDNLSIIYANGDNSNSVTQNITFLSYGKNGSTITWTTNAKQIINDKGIVKRPKDYNKSVRITATISFGNASLTKTFDTIVKADLSKQTKPTPPDKSKKEEKMDVFSGQGITIKNKKIANFNRGETTNLVGEVTAEKGIKKITVRITDKNGKNVMKNTSVTPNGLSTYSLSSNELSKKITFQNLPAGKMTLIITVEDMNGTQVSKKVKFEVKKEKKPKLTELPQKYTIKKGQNLKLKGIVNASSPLVKITAQVNRIGSSKATYSAPNNSGRKSYNLSQLKLKTAKLKPGDYVISIYITTKNGSNTYAGAIIDLTIK